MPSKAARTSQSHWGGPVLASTEGSSAGDGKVTGTVGASSTVGGNEVDSADDWGSREGVGTRMAELSAGTGRAVARGAAGSAPASDALEGRTVGTGAGAGVACLGAGRDGAGAASLLSGGAVGAGASRVPGSEKSRSCSGPTVPSRGGGAGVTTFAGAVCATAVPPVLRSRQARQKRISGAKGWRVIDAVGDKARLMAESRALGKHSC